MPFAPDSIFVAQPLLLNIRQRRFLVGIRYAVETAQLAEKRLLDALRRWHDKQNDPSISSTQIEIFADAWAIVDNARRFQRLLWKMDGVAHIDIAKNFVKRWPQLKNMRDAMQHPDKDFSKSTLNNSYVYGTFYWIDARERPSTDKVFAYVMNAGPQANYELPKQEFPVPIAYDYGDDIYSIILRTADALLNISDLMQDITETVTLLDQQFSIEAHKAIELEKRRHPDRSTKLDSLASSDTWFRLELSPNLQTE